jgi:hypothetical protein
MMERTSHASFELKCGADFRISNSLISTSDSLDISFPLWLSGLGQAVLFICSIRLQKPLVLRGHKRPE